MLNINYPSIVVLIGNCKQFIEKFTNMQSKIITDTDRVYMIDYREGFIVEELNRRLGSMLNGAELANFIIVLGEGAQIKTDIFAAISQIDMLNPLISVKSYFFFLLFNYKSNLVSSQAKCLDTLKNNIKPIRDKLIIIGDMDSRGSAVEEECHNEALLYAVITQVCGILNFTGAVSSICLNELVIGEETLNAVKQYYILKKLKYNFDTNNLNVTTNLLWNLFFKTIFKTEYRQESLKEQLMFSLEKIYAPFMPSPEDAQDLFKIKRLNHSRSSEYDKVFQEFLKLNKNLSGIEQKIDVYLNDWNIEAIKTVHKLIDLNETQTFFAEKSDLCMSLKSIIAERPTGYQSTIINKNNFFVNKKKEFNKVYRNILPIHKKSLLSYAAKSLYNKITGEGGLNEEIEKCISMGTKLIDEDLAQMQNIEDFIAVYSNYAQETKNIVDMTEVINIKYLIDNKSKFEDLYIKNDSKKWLDLSDYFAKEIDFSLLANSFIQVLISQFQTGQNLINNIEYNLSKNSAYMFAILNINIISGVSAFIADDQLKGRLNGTYYFSPLDNVVKITKFTLFEEYKEFFDSLDNPSLLPQCLNDKQMLIKDVGKVGGSMPVKTNDKVIEMKTSGTGGNASNKNKLEIVENYNVHLEKRNSDYYLCWDRPKEAVDGCQIYINDSKLGFCSIQDYQRQGRGIKIASNFNIPYGIIEKIRIDYVISRITINVENIRGLTRTVKIEIKNRSISIKVLNSKDFRNIYICKYKGKRKVYFPLDHNNNSKIMQIDNLNIDGYDIKVITDNKEVIVEQS